MGSKKPKDSRIKKGRGPRGRNKLRNARLLRRMLQKRKLLRRNSPRKPYRRKLPNKPRRKPRRNIKKRRSPKKIRPPKMSPLPSLILINSSFMQRSRDYKMNLHAQRKTPQSPSKSSASNKQLSTRPMNKTESCSKNSSRWHPVVQERLKPQSVSANSRDS